MIYRKQYAAKKSGRPKGTACFLYAAAAAAPGAEIARAAGAKHGLVRSEGTATEKNYAAEAARRRFCL